MSYTGWWWSEWRCWWFKLFVIMTTSFPTPRFCFWKKNLRSDLLLSKGSYRALGWHAHHNPKTVPGLPEFDSDVNSCDSCISADWSFFFLSLLVQPLKWNARSKGTKPGNYFQMNVVSQSWADLFGRVGVCLSLSKYILIANMADTALIEHHRQHFFQPTRCHKNILKTSQNHNVP